MINKKMKRTISMLLASVMVAAALTGCGKKADDGSGNASTGEGKKQVQVVDFWSAPNQLQYNFWEEKANAFNATKTEVNGKVIEVKVQQMPETPSSEAGIQNAIATGTVPAVSENVNRGFAATLAESGVIYDLQDLDWFKNVVSSRAMETAIEGWAIDGKQYVLPVYVNPMTWQWNLKALKALGFEAAPTTMEEYKAVIKAFSENKDAMKELGVSHSFYRPSLLRGDQWWDRWHDFQMVYQTFTGGKEMVEGNKLVLDEEGAKEAFEFLGLLGNTVLTSELSSVWLDENPGVLFTVNAPWEIDAMREAGKVYGEDYVYGPAILKNEGDTPYYYADAKGLAFYKHDSISEDEHQGAVEFVSWVYSEENSSATDLDWLETTTQLPVRGDLVSNEAFAEKFAAYPELEALAAFVPNAVPCMSHSKMTEIQTALTDKGMAPYIEAAMKTEPLNAPDATSYVEEAMKAMKEAGGLE